MSEEAKGTEVLLGRASYLHEERNAERMTSDAAFMYRPCFPFVYKTEKTMFNDTWVGRLVVTPIFVVLGPLIAIFRLLAFILFQSIVTICGFITTWNYPEDEPLKGWRIALVKAVAYPMYFLMITAWGIVFLPNYRKRVRRPRICVSNHVSILDIFIMILCEGPAFVSKRGVLRVPILGKAMRILRVMYVRTETGKGEGATEVFKRRIAAMRVDPGWRPIHIFPEGTTTTEHGVLRFHTSIFRLEEDIQPVCIKYLSYNNVGYVGQNVWAVLYRYLTNPFVIARIVYLDPISARTNTGELKDPRAFADEAGRAIAKELGAVYLPYNNEDAFYFRGIRQDSTRCTSEFQRDYGWIGTLRTFEERVADAEGAIKEKGE